MTDLEKFLNECESVKHYDLAGQIAFSKLREMVRLLLPSDPQGQYGRIVLEQLNKIAKGEQEC
jgi:hypothetical protein